MFNDLILQFLSIFINIVPHVIQAIYISKLTFFQTGN